MSFVRAFFGGMASVDSVPGCTERDHFAAISIGVHVVGRAADQVAAVSVLLVVCIVSSRLGVLDRLSRHLQARDWASLLFVTGVWTDENPGFVVLLAAAGRLVVTVSHLASLVLPPAFVSEIADVVRKRLRDFGKSHGGSTCSFQLSHHEPLCHCRKTQVNLAYSRWKSTQHGFMGEIEGFCLSTVRFLHTRYTYLSAL